MMFSRWDSEQDCLAEMLCLHDEETAAFIVAQIAARVEAGTLFKSDDRPMQIISKDDDEEIVIYGPCTWELRDPEGDVVTTAGMVDFFQKWFTQVEEEYRCVMLDHGNFKVGVPLLTYEGKDGKYATHVHEKGAMLITKLRPDDGLRATKKFREDVILGVYKSYSISWWPIRFEMKVDDEGVKTYYHYEMDPVETTICRYGMNEMAKFGIAKRYTPQNIELLMQRLEAVEGVIVKNHTTAIGPEALITDAKIQPNMSTSLKIMDFVLRSKAVMLKEEEMTVDDIEAIIEDLKAEREAIRETIDEYYEGFPDTPDWVQDAYDRLDDIWQELSAWKDARIALLTGVGKTGDVLGLNVTARTVLKEIREKLQRMTEDEKNRQAQDYEPEHDALKIEEATRKVFVELNTMLKDLQVASEEEEPDPDEEEEKPCPDDEEELKDDSDLETTINFITHKAFKDAFKYF